MHGPARALLSGLLPSVIMACDREAKRASLVRCAAAGASRGAASMNVTVRYLAQAREAAGRASEEIELDGPTTLHDLIVRLARQHGSAFAKMALDGAGGPHPSLLVVIGDEH